MKVNKIFVSGKMDKDSDERYLKNGDYRDANNVRVLSSEGSDVGTVENVQGNEKLTDLYLTLSNAKTVGGYADHANEKLYWFITADEFHAIVEYNKTTGERAYVLQHTTLLNFSQIKGVNLIDGILFWTDGVNPPRCVQIARAKDYGLDGFTEIDISVLKAPPLAPPDITLTDNGSEENNIREKFLAFSHRYKFLDGQYSALSPFTRYAFEPKNFQYNYAKGSNESMVNKFNAVEIFFNTGNRTVTEIDLVFKESGSDIIYVIDSFNKALLTGYTDNTTKSFVFDNSKIYRILPEDEIHRMFDNVPILANVQESAENRIMYGDYLEHFDILDGNDDKIEIVYSVKVNSYPVTDNNAVPSLKSNRDYEVGINYLNDDGRITTTLTSKTNTVFIPSSKAILQNKLQVEITSPPPSFATKYRWFIKQSKGDYDYITPNLFYRKGAYVWVKLENKDREKISEGDYLIIKADTTGLVSTLKYTEVLEVKVQEENFLELDSVVELKQPAGLYYKLFPDNFSLNLNDIEVQDTFTYSHSKNDTTEFYTGEADVIEQPIFYKGTIGDGVDDLHSYGNYVVVNIDYRYEIGIFSKGNGTTTFDTYKYRKSNTDAWVTGGSGFAISVGVVTAIENGLQIMFDSNTGHEEEDYWIISCKSKDDDNLLEDDFDHWFPSRAFAIYGGVFPDETIYGNANIYISYRENGEVTNIAERNVTATKNYVNLEEWWFGDDIISQFPELDMANIWFRRGFIGESTDGFGRFTQNTDGVMSMIIRGEGITNNRLDGSCRISARIVISQSTQPVIFETKATDYNSDVFFEIGETYDIIDGKHQGNLYNDGDWGIRIPNDDPDLVVWGEFGGTSILDIYNCFTFGNGFESYKIKDGWNATSMKMDTRPSLVYNEYKRIYKFASVTYSGIYNKSTNVNDLNEFNLSTGNFKDFDEKFGNVRVLYNDNGNLLMIQEDATSQILYNKKILYDVEGVENVASSAEVLGSQKYYTGEHGISLDSFTFAVRGGRKYWLDSKRGCAVRLGESGVEEISKHGMYDWFKDIFKANTFSIKLGVYDPFYDEYIAHIQTAEGYKTLSFNEVPKGWVSFYTIEPEFMLAMNNDLYSFKNGELYEHHSNNVPRQEFYGESNEFDITVVVNDEPSMDKVFKTFSTESTAPFDVAIATNYTYGNIYKNEFTKKESWYYSDIKQSEDESDYSGFNANGIGNILAFNNYNKAIMISKPVPQNISIGDMLWMQFADNDVRKIGTITNIADGNIFLNTITNPLTAGKFIFATKNARIEGSEMRGYYLEAKLTSGYSYPVELNGITVKTDISNV